MTEAASTATLGTADIARVLKLLPHRYPFLMIDRIIDIDGDNSAIGIKNVTINEPFFQGHFPGFPIMPGVLLIEGMAQTAGAICVAALGETYQPHIVYFMSHRQGQIPPAGAAWRYRALPCHARSAIAGRSGASSARPRSTACWSRKAKSAP